MKKKKEWKPDGYIKSHLRIIWRWSPQRRECLKQAYDQKTKRFTCVSCSNKVNKPYVDHINPVIDPKNGFRGWDEYYNRLFCPISGLQVLCKKCHDKKSKEENRLRNQYRALEELSKLDQELNL